MTISNYRATEALYLVIVRDKTAEDMLKTWARSSNVQVTIEGNKMKVFEHRTINLFYVNWPHGWDNVTVWDCWNRRHIYLD